ncbi:MAG: hypothetical protein ACC661_01270, partial [Verrucomicrobiales bacterium]
MKKAASAGGGRLTPLVATVCLGLGLAGGFLLGRIGVERPGDADEMAEPGAQSPTIGRRTTPEKAPGRSMSTTGNAASDLSLSPGVNLPSQLVARLVERVAGNSATGFRQGREWYQTQGMIFELDENLLPEATAAVADLSNAPSATQALSLLFTRWAEVDIPAALAAAEGIENLTNRQNALSATLTQWAQNDPDAAWTYALENNPGNNGVRNLLSNVAATLAATDPQRAVALAEALDNPAARNQIYQNIASAWVSSDPEAALAWADTMDDPWFARRIRPTILNGIARSDPERGLELALAEQDDNLRGQALNNVISQLSQTNPEAALEALRQFEEGTLPSNYLNSLGYSLGNLAPERVLEAIAHLGDEATERYLGAASQLRIQRGAIDEALELVERLPEGRNRENTLRNLVSTWA